MIIARLCCVPGQAGLQGNSARTCYYPTLYLPYQTNSSSEISKNSDSFFVYLSPMLQRMDCGRHCLAWLPPPGATLVIVYCLLAVTPARPAPCPASAPPPPPRSSRLVSPGNSHLQPTSGNRIIEAECVLGDQ